MQAVGLVNDLYISASSDAALVVGPLLVGNVLNWALWGVLSTQLLLFVCGVSASAPGPARGPSSKGQRAGSRSGALGLPFARTTGAKGAAGVGRKRFGYGFRSRAGAEPDEDINPWTMSFAAPASLAHLSVSAYPPSNQPQAYPNQRRSQVQARHVRQQSSKSSFDPYVPSPTSAEDSLDLPAHLNLGMRPNANANAAARPPTRPTVVAAVGNSATPMSSLSQLLGHAKSTGSFREEVVNREQDADALPLPLPRAVFITMVVLYVLVCVQVLLATVQLWHVAVGGWGPRAPADLGVGWAEVVIADCMTPIVFLIAMFYFIHALLLSPSAISFLSRAQGNTDARHPNAKMSSALRPLSFLKAKLAHQHIDTDSLPRPYTSTTAQHAGRTDLDLAAAPSASWAGAPTTPSLWSRCVSKLQRTFYSWSTLIRIYGHGFIPPAFLGLLAALVAVCGLINCARIFKHLPPIGVPPILDGIAYIWYAGMLVLNAIVCALLSLTLLRRRAFSTSVSAGLFARWFSYAARVLGEAGGAQSIVAFLALVLIVVWRGEKPRSTIMLVPTTLLPALYANTVLLHATRSYTSFSLFFLSSSDAGRDAAEKATGGANAYTPSKAKYDDRYNNAEDIEMGLRVVDIGIPHGRNAAVAERVVDLSAAGLELAGTSTGTETYSTTGASTGDRGAALRAQALAYGAQLERERQEKEQRELGTGAGIASGNGSGSGSGVAVETKQTAQPVRMHMERDMNGGSSATRAGTGEAGDVTVGRAMAGPSAQKANASSIRSRISRMSQGALSLELPVFRRGRARDIYEYDSEYLWDDDSDAHSDISSIDGGDGTWDYGYGINVTNAEREKERDERERAATLLAVNSAVGEVNSIPGGQAGGTGAIGVAGTGQQLQGPRARSSYPAPSNSRPTSWRRSALSRSYLAGTAAEGNGDNASAEESDRLSVLSSTSRRTRSRSRSRYSHPHHHYQRIAHPLAPIPARRPLPRTPGAVFPSASAVSSAAASVDDVSFSGSPAGSVLIIGRHPEPSFVEPSVFRAASVAATRASTGSAWSSYTYPKPVQLPDLDMEFAPPESIDHTFGETTGLSSFNGLSGLEELTGTSSAVARGENGPHPYSSAADDRDVRQKREEESSGRRWRVHPLKRKAEKGWLRR
ncbi:hypothetical protein M0805_004691 [Coniferiporia weirii]|nr:hypothetical protein M0805_004691 [Coniferiporia weirii]